MNQRTATSPGPDQPPSSAPAVPQYQPRDRFWPYVDVPEEPTDEEIAALDPDLRAELFGTGGQPFSLTVVFPRFDAPDYARAVELAKGSNQYLELGQGAEFRHRARFLPKDVVQLRDLWAIVGRLDAADVLIDDRPIPYARQLWLPLFWFLLLR